MCYIQKNKSINYFRNSNNAPTAAGTRKIHNSGKIKHTPDGELPFAGHPTIGTAFLLVSEGRVPATLVQTSAAGDVPVQVDLAGARATMLQLPPVFGEPIED